MEASPYDFPQRYCVLTMHLNLYRNKKLFGALAVVAALLCLISVFVPTHMVRFVLALDIQIHNVQKNCNLVSFVYTPTQ